MFLGCLVAELICGPLFVQDITQEVAHIQLPVKILFKINLVYLKLFLQPLALML